MCPEPVGDSWGVKSLLVVGPIRVGANLTFVTQFYQNLEVYEGGRVVKARPVLTYMENHYRDSN